MQSRRPAPLSDQLFAGPVLLGSRGFGAPLPVKNTFVDLPSGFTPTSAKFSMRAPLLTAPAGLHKEITIPADYCLLISPVHAGETSSPEGPEPEPEAVAHADGGMIEPAGAAWCDVDAEEEDDESEDDMALPSAPVDAPAPPPGALHPSIGSEGHAASTCKRCCFFARNRCANGYDCAFCHYEHERRKRKNKKSKKTKHAQLAAVSAFCWNHGRAVIAPQAAQLSLGQIVGQPCMLPVQAPMVYHPCTVMHHMPMGSAAVMCNAVQAPLQGCYVTTQQLAQPFPQHLPQQFQAPHAAQFSQTTFGTHVAAHVAAQVSYLHSGHGAQAGQAVGFTPAGSEVIPPPPSHSPRFPLRR